MTSPWGRWLQKLESRKMYKGIGQVHLPTLHDVTIRKGFSKIAAKAAKSKHFQQRSICGK